MKDEKMTIPAAPKKKSAPRRKKATPEAVIPVDATTTTASAAPKIVMPQEPLVKNAALVEIFDKPETISDQVVVPPKRQEKTTQQRPPIQNKSVAPREVAVAPAEPVPIAPSAVQQSAPQQVQQPIQQPQQQQQMQQAQPYNQTQQASGQQYQSLQQQHQQPRKNKKFNNHRSPDYKHQGQQHYNRQDQGGYQQRQHPQGQQNQYPNQSQEAPLPKILTRELLEEMSMQELNMQARRWGIIGASLMSHKELVERILEAQQHPDREIIVEGVLERLPDGFGFLRSPRFDYISSPDDIYVSPSQIRRFGLRTGDTVLGTIRKPKDGEKYYALLRLDKVNFQDPIKLNERPAFDRLSPMHPDRKFNLEFDPLKISTRLMDIFTPIGCGQRGLIVAQPKAGKTMLLKEIAQSLIANHPDVYLMVLLIDERPEEVADMRRCIKGAHAEVVSSTFDESAERHVQVAEIVLEKGKRLVEAGKDVVILLDALTRLARAYNTVAPASGKVLTGGIDANALQHPKRFFGAARCMEEGGSLTIIATALIETGSRMDEVIYEEFKGTGNMEMHLSRKLANRRIYPAYDLLMSSTRRDDLLFTEEEQKRSWVLQKFLSNMNPIEGMEFMIDKMKKFKTNEEFFSSMNKSAGSSSNGNGNGNGNGSH